MILVLLVSLLLSPCLCQSMFEMMNDGGYRFAYNTGDEGGHARTENRRGPDGPVVGKFSYVDPNGFLREIRYTADEDGFKPEGDISVDRKTAEEAAALNALPPGSGAPPPPPISSSPSNLIAPVPKPHSTPATTIPPPPPPPPIQAPTSAPTVQRAHYGFVPPAPWWARANYGYYPWHHGAYNPYYRPYY